MTTGYGIRNVPVLRQAIAEIHRVLKPGRSFLSLDFNRPSNALVRGVYLSYLTIVGSALGFVLHRDPDTYRYIPESIRRYPGAAAVCGIVARGGVCELRGDSGSRRSDGDPSCSEVSWRCVAGMARIWRTAADAGTLCYHARDGVRRRGMVRRGRLHAGAR